jgi:hypothetical protein
VTPAASENNQPVLVIAGLFVDKDRLAGLTHDFLNAKYRFFPGLCRGSLNYLDRIIPEVKGADLRRNITRGSHAQQRQVIGFLDHIFDIVEQHDVKLVARIWIKGLGQPFVGRSVYTSSIQSLCTYFDHHLAQVPDFGFCIADSRAHLLNVEVSHSVFTQKFRAVPTVYQRIVEVPTFGQSENHAGIQLCDILCSALLYPIACFAYCTGFVGNVHVQPRASVLRQRYGERIKNLQHRYQDLNGRWTGGMVVSDALQQRNSAAMFR